MDNSSKNLAVVIVTYNRLALLQQCLEKLAAQTYKPDAVFVINNASTDGKTQDYLDNYQGSLPLTPIHNPVNTGGAGGFSTGIKHAYKAGFAWIYVMDDDVFMHPDCLHHLMAIQHPCMIAVREAPDGSLVERAAIRYNLSNPFYLNPKRATVAEYYQKREAMPETVLVENVAFEGFILHRDVIQKVDYPNPKYFIFYDDVDYALRIRNAGFTILAVRDAILVRQLPFNQESALDSWKAFYMFRNLFHIHYAFGKNILVRYKPYWLALGAILIYSIKGKRNTVRAIWKSIRSFKLLSK